MDQRSVEIAAMMIGNQFEDAMNGSLIELPPGTQVQVLKDPICRSSQTYVKVAYQGKIGWMLEVYANTYYLAPVEQINPAE